ILFFINRIYFICRIIKLSFFHSLDDIQDNSIMREGYPVTHSIYGLGNTINAANYVQFVAFEKLANLHPAATKIFIEEMLECYRTQGMEIYLTNNFICPTEKDYKIMATRKSSWTVKLAVRLMKLFSTYEGDISSLISAFGMYYQIRNDYCNFFHKNDNGKSYCDDLTEGKFSLPIIHAINSNPDDTQIINILKQHTTDIEMKRHCVKLLDSFGSLKY
ncbi:PREDICTED: geranylgeranyl pyrophosphate synthase-like, partial [Wasmannia auropunctata]|uniref:geranylgeranyl pyrophosphate synthase-like n=1 Tax=Wasmannia auropunctata TaxID=64793 RepID=UPI0005F0138D